MPGTERGAAELPRLTRGQGPRPAVGIVHLGLGAFFRAHGALYVAEAMQRSGGDWGIVGVSLRHPDQRDRLAPQGFAYTALELGPDGETPQVVEVIEDVLVAPESPEAVLARMADPRVRIVSLTVTEKGYCHDPATGRLNAGHPDIAHDLAHPEAPRSAPGFLVAALARRRAGGTPAFTVLSCDNLPENGAMVRGVVLDLARRLDPGLADWIAAEATFPCTMVDRIVPATRPEDVARVAELTGRRDAAPVVHEPFRQWVVEDRFVGGARPDLGAVGVQLVRDVGPFELMKLRMLNGTHSALAYLGYLAGHETIAETVAEPAFAAFVRRLWAEEIIPTLAPPPGEDLGAYAAALLARYRNPAIRHRTWQIAMDGSQKLPQRILGTLADNRAAGRASPGLVLAVAAWMRYVGGQDEAGAPIDVRDPFAARLRAASDGGAEPAAKVAALLAVREVFPPGSEALLEPLTAAYAGLVAGGARAAVEAIVAGRAPNGAPAPGPAGEAAIVVMGVSGSGKSSVGAGLAAALGLPFQEGDALHPPANVAKMAAGVPLDDADRWPWLDRVAAALGRGGVVSCSALKRSYRDRLRAKAGRPVAFVFLRGSPSLLAERMRTRSGHFMPASLLASQLATLEDPSGEPGTVTVDIDRPVSAIVDAAAAALRGAAGPFRAG